MIQKLKKSNAGFTLVELIVVIAILGILAAVLVPQYVQYVERARVANDQANAATLLSEVQVALADPLNTITISATPATNIVTMNASGTTVGAGITGLDTALSKISGSWATTKTTGTALKTYTITIDATNKTATGAWSA